MLSGSAFDLKFNPPSYRDQILGTTGPYPPNHVIMLGFHIRFEWATHRYENKKSTKGTYGDALVCFPAVPRVYEVDGEIKVQS